MLFAKYELSSYSFMLPNMQTNIKLYHLHSYTFILVLVDHVLLWSDTKTKSIWTNQKVRQF